MFFKDFSDYYKHNNQLTDEIILNISVFDAQIKPHEINIIKYLNNNLSNNSPLNFKKNFVNIDNSLIF
jgi:hypothetical protein